MVEFPHAQETFNPGPEVWEGQTGRRGAGRTHSEVDADVDV